MQGAHGLRLTYDPVGAAAAGSGGSAGTAGAMEGDWQLHSEPAPAAAAALPAAAGAIKPMVLVLELDILHGKLAPDGYRLSLTAPAGMQVRARMLFCASVWGGRRRYRIHFRIIAMSELL